MSFERYGLNLGGFVIYYYAMILTLGILTAFFVGVFLFKLVGYKEEIAYMLLLFCLPLGIFCARLYYVVFYDISMFADFFNLRNGGIAIYGGIIGGAIGIFIVSRIKKVGYFTLADIVVIGVILAQSIGRWGNYVNQEAYGLYVGVNAGPFTTYIDDPKHGDRVGYYLATFFYESILNLIGFVVLLTYYVIKIRREKYQYGTVSAMYLIWYGITRAIIEPMRSDSLLIFGSNQIVFNRVSFMLSLAIIVAGVLLLWLVKKGKISQENKACMKK